MKQTLFAATVALGLLACTAGPSASPEPAASTYKYFGRFSYDGINAILTGCDGQVYWLQDSLWQGVMNEVVHFKQDPSYTVWIQVECDEPAQATTRGPIILRSGSLGSTRKDPCPK